MKVIKYLMIFSIALLAACGTKEENKQQSAANVQPAADMHKVLVKEVINEASGYTYLFVEEGGKEFWVAITKADVNVGETIYYQQGMEMKDFKSTSLDRTFDSIWFVSNASKTPVNATASTPGMASPHGDMGMANTEAAAVPGAPKVGKSNVKVEKAAGGYTVAQIFKDKSKLSMKNVIVRGKVTKVNNGIMDRNWIHIQDGTEHDGNFDLLITSQENVKAGDVVTFEGKLMVDQDFGFGYKYDLLVKDGKVK